MSDVLDLLYPYAGPCGICGGPDKRHRLADAIVDDLRAGSSPRLVADDYHVSVAAVEALGERSEQRRRQHRARWS